MMLDLLEPVGDWLKNGTSDRDRLKEALESIPDWLKDTSGSPSWAEGKPEGARSPSWFGDGSGPSWLKDEPEGNPDGATPEASSGRNWLDTFGTLEGTRDLVSGLNAMTWQVIGETMGSSIQCTRDYGNRFDELDAARDGRMREHLGRSIREQFDLDLETIACRLAISDGNVAPEELALINGALGTSLDETALRERAASATPAGDEEFFGTPPQSFVAAVVYDNLLFAETKNADDSCAELLLRTLKTLCEEILICDGSMADDEVDHFTALMTAVQELLVEKLDSWEGKPRISTLALSPRYDNIGTDSAAASAAGATSAANAQGKTAEDAQAKKEAKSEAADAEDEATLEELLEELNSLTGMKQVKEEISSLVNLARIQKAREEHGIKQNALSLHLVFYGNPGTGKTTVARLVSRFYKKLGILSKGHLVEVDRSGLVAGYVGQTALKTAEVIEKALGGVLFIDEAYALLDTSSGVEALAVLVKAMEDHKGELVVMFAGYEAEMRAFVDANPGLASRIGYQFHFEDYKPEELRDMFVRKMEAAGFVLGEGVDEQALALMRYFHNVENFGNGRFVDRVIQETIAGRANRDADDVHEVAACDLPTTEAMCKLVASTVYDPSDVSGDEALRRVASHEVGHALVGLEETGRTDIVTITIEQEGTGALGYVQHEKVGGPLPTAADLRARLAMLLAGMAAEQMVYGAYSAGNSSDLEQATSLARAYVATYGMSDAGFVQYVRPSSQKATPVSDLPEDVRAQMKDLLDGAFVRAGEVLATNRAKFERMVDYILEKGTATGEQLIAVWKGEEPAADEGPAAGAAGAANEEPATDAADNVSAADNESKGSPLAHSADEEGEDAR